MILEKKEKIRFTKISKICKFEGLFNIQKKKTKLYKFSFDLKKNNLVSQKCLNFVVVVVCAQILDLEKKKFDKN